MTSFEEPDNFRSSQTNQEIMIREQVDCQEGEPRPTPSQHLQQLPPGSSLTLTPKYDRDVHQLPFKYIERDNVEDCLSNIPTDDGESSQGFIITTMCTKMTTVHGCYKAQELMESETCPLVEAEKSYEWTKGEQLGRGTFGACFKGTDNRTKFTFAKKMFLMLMQIEKDRKLFIYEAVTLNRLDHRNIVKLYGVQWNFKIQKFSIWMEYIEGDTLDKFLEKYREKKETLDPNLCLQIFKEMLVAIDHCHARGVVHGDFHTGNIMVRLCGKTLIVKLIDFGTNNTEKSRSDDIRNVVQVFQSMLRRPYRQYWSTENEKFTNTGLPEWIFKVLNYVLYKNWKPSAKDLLDKIPGDTEDSNPDTCLDEIEQRTDWDC